MHSYLQGHSKFVRAVLVLVQMMSRKNNFVTMHVCWRILALYWIQQTLKLHVSKLYLKSYYLANDYIKIKGCAAMHTWSY